MLWMEDAMTEEDIRRAAYDKWEAEDKPDGQGIRHWLEAERDLKASGEYPSDDDDSRPAPTSSQAIPSQEGEPGRFKPGELASENK